MSRVVFLVPLFLALLVALPARATEWTLDPQASRIGWTAKWNTSPVRGGFERFDAEIVFAPDALDAASVRIRIEIDSIFLEGQDARSTLTNRTWFSAREHPRALVESKAFRNLGNGRYEMIADLTIRDVTREIVLPFKLTIEGDTARMEGGLTLDRLTFGIGREGDFAKAVGPEVDVSIAVTAHRRG